jgi:hypothetical protein
MTLFYHTFGGMVDMIKHLTEWDHTRRLYHKFVSPATPCAASTRAASMWQLLLELELYHQFTTLVTLLICYMYLEFISTSTNMLTAQCTSTRLMSVGKQSAPSMWTWECHSVTALQSRSWCFFSTTRSHQLRLTGRDPINIKTREVGSIEDEFTSQVLAQISNETTFWLVNAEW